MNLYEAMDIIGSIENRCAIAAILIAQVDCPECFYYTLFKDIYVDAQYLIDEFCREDDGQEET